MYGINMLISASLFRRNLCNNHIPSPIMRTYSICKRKTLTSLHTRRFSKCFVDLCKKNSSFSEQAQISNTPDYLVNIQRSNHGLLVYKGNLDLSVKGAKIISFSSSFAGILVMWVVFSQGALQQIPLMGGLLGSLAGFFCLGTPFLLHLLSRRYVTVLYHNTADNLFTAVTYSFFMRRKLFTFTPADVQQISVPSLFTTFHAKGKPFVIEPKLMEPTSYCALMGYDRPDFLTNVEKEFDEGGFMKRYQRYKQWLDYKDNP